MQEIQNETCNYKILYEKELKEKELYQIKFEEASKRVEDLDKTLRVLLMDISKLKKAENIRDKMAVYISKNMYIEKKETIKTVTLEEEYGKNREYLNDNIDFKVDYSQREKNNNDIPIVNKKSVKTENLVFNLTRVSDELYINYNSESLRTSLIKTTREEMAIILERNIGMSGMIKDVYNKVLNRLYSSASPSKLLKDIYFELVYTIIFPRRQVLNSSEVRVNRRTSKKEYDLLNLSYTNLVGLATKVRQLMYCFFNILGVEYEATGTVQEDVAKNCKRIVLLTNQMKNIVDSNSMTYKYKGSTETSVLTQFFKVLNLLRDGKERNLIQSQEVLLELSEGIEHFVKESDSGLRRKDFINSLIVYGLFSKKTIDKYSFSYRDVEKILGVKLNTVKAELYI